MDFHDQFSSLSHLLMAGWCVFTGLILLRLTRRHSRAQRLSVLFYTVSTVTLYSASGLFHGLQHTTTADRRLWQLIDQSAIFGLIFGSNLPLYVYLLPKLWRRRLTVMMALVGLTGVALIWVTPWIYGAVPHLLLVMLYLAMGFLGLLPLRSYVHKMGNGCLFWIAMLASAYVGGAVCEAIRWPVLVPGYLGYHEILHVADVVGTLSHLVLLVRYVLPHGKTESRIRKFPGSEWERKI